MEATELPESIDTLRRVLSSRVAASVGASKRYDAALKVSEQADRAIFAAYENGEAGAGFDRSLIEAAGAARDALQEARGAELVIGQSVVEAANAIVEAVAGAGMVKAIADLSTRDPDVLAWRAARNALVADAEAVLPGEAHGAVADPRAADAVAKRAD